MFREHQNNWSQAFQASRNHTKDGRDNVGITCEKRNGLNVFLTFNLTRCFCLHDWHHEHGLHFCFFLSHCGHVFGIKHPKRERNAFLSPSSTKGITSVRFAIKEKEPPSRHVGFVYLFPELLRRAGLCGYFFKEMRMVP